MAAMFHVREIELPSDAPCPIAAWAWRGCCLELFSRGEHAVAECIGALADAGIPLGKNAYNPFAVQRLRALRTCLTTHAFGGHERFALKLLESWEELCEERNWLAHALIEPTGDGIIARHISFDGKVEKQWPPRIRTRLEMRELLLKVESTQIRLLNQLGQIKAAIRQIKPDPGSTPG